MPRLTPHPSLPPTPVCAVSLLVSITNLETKIVNSTKVKGKYYVPACFQTYVGTNKPKYMQTLTRQKSINK